MTISQRQVSCIEHYVLTLENVISSVYPNVLALAIEQIYLFCTHTQTIQNTHN